MSAIPVVVLHGALRGRAGLWPTVAYLRSAGLNARAFGYRTRTDGLDVHGARLESFLEDWLGGPVPVLGVLTHSMGALVARAYLARAGVRRQSVEQRLVMLAPPNQGSNLARHHRDLAVFRWLYGAAAEELQPERVAELPPLPGSCSPLILAGGSIDGRGYNHRLAGDDDGVVAFAETVLGPHLPERVGGVHSFLQWRPDVLSRAAEFIGSDRERPSQ
jgi:hypothetical protein